MRHDPLKNVSPDLFRAQAFLRRRRIEAQGIPAPEQVRGDKGTHFGRQGARFTTALAFRRRFD
jgi:hypothetical protein